MYNTKTHAKHTPLAIMLAPQLITWALLFNTPSFLFLHITAFDPGPDAIDFYQDPLMPREGDAIILESQLLRKPLKHPPKESDYRWYFREMDSKPEDFRLLGVGSVFRYQIPTNFQDGYFNLSVTCCCTPRGEMFQLENVKLIRIQRELKVKVFVDRKPLPGNQSEMILATSRAAINMECRIWGLPTRFQFRLPFGMTCQSQKTRNKRRYVSVIRRRCRFRRGPFFCSASNDVSKVKMIHYLQQAPKSRPLTTRPPLVRPVTLKPPKTAVKTTSMRTAPESPRAMPEYDTGPKNPSKAQATVAGSSSRPSPFHLLTILVIACIVAT